MICIRCRQREVEVSKGRVKKTFCKMCGHYMRRKAVEKEFDVQEKRILFHIAILLSLLLIYIAFFT